jgi:hypothetical protein
VTEIEDLKEFVAGQLATILDDATSSTRLILDEASDVFYALELLIPAILRLRYPEWEHESIDGFRLSSAVKMERSLQLLGVCILIGDQTTTPFQMRLTLTDEASLTGSRVRLGEPGAGPLGISGPPCNSRSAAAQLASLEERAPEVAWVYEADL